MATVYFDPPYDPMTQGPTQLSSIEDATTDLVGFAFQAEEDATVVSVLFYIVTKTGTPGTVRAGFQGVNASTGLNDGVWQSYVDVAGTSITAGGYNTFTLSTTQNVTRGQLYCIVIQPISGTWNSTNSIAVWYGRGNSYPWSGLPYAFTNTTGTTAKVTTNQHLFWGYRSATKSYGTPMFYIGSGARNVNTNPNEYGNRFTLPSTRGKQFTLLGINANLLLDAGGTFSLNLYDSNSNLITTRSFDSDQAVNLGQDGTYQILFTDSALPTLSYGTQYIVGLKALSVANMSMAFTCVTILQDQTAFLRSTMSMIQRKDSGVWQVNANLIPSWQLMIRDTSGGGVGYPGMTGGMRG